MMNCVLEWTFPIDEPLILGYPTPLSSNRVNGMSIREDEHVWTMTVIRGWKECDLDAEIGRI